MDQESKKILESLRARTQAARLLSGIASFSGIAAIPFIFIGIFANNQALAAASLCWLVGNCAGYIARIFQEEHQESIVRLGIAEATFSAKALSQDGPLPRRVSMN